MGPQHDSPECPVTQICSHVIKRKTDYWNKALVIDYLQSRLISCGIVANNAKASTVAFIAPGPSKLPRMHVLYVGVSYTGHGP
ncbi:Plexin-A4-like protein [Leptotrombidium deliense]|uniref:Plexin-A4-like protein n=1 Tax=Leptotrombidium deliense TaxID=299467 RepID=A0A443S2R4_9ACAR|nr:Plexin-A4-like protein [Leptotrombidium deliense]